MMLSLGLPWAAGCTAPTSEPALPGASSESTGAGSVIGDSGHDDDDHTHGVTTDDTDDADDTHDTVDTHGVTTDGSDDDATDDTSSETGGLEECALDVVLPGDPQHCSPVVDPTPGAVPAAVLDAFCSPALRPGARTVMVIGDSFSRDFAEELAARIGADARLCTMSRPGARASQWVADEDLHDVGHGIRSLSLAALSGTTAPRVIVTMGAADVGNEFLAAGTGVHAAVHCDLARILADIAQVTPDAEIVIAGYDITNMNPGFFSETLNLSCPEAAAQQFGVETIENPDGDGVVVAQPACANAPLYALDSVYSRLADDDAQVHYLPLYGTLQDLPPGQPDLDRFANVAYYRDCVHMSDDGALRFVDQFEALWGLVE